MRYQLASPHNAMEEYKYALYISPFRRNVRLVRLWNEGHKANNVKEQQQQQQQRETTAVYKTNNSVPLISACSADCDNA